MKIHYTGQQGGPYGWGRFGENIVKEMLKRSIYADDPKDADAIFHVLTNHDLEPLSPIRGKINVGLTFFELPLGSRAAENAKKYDTVFVGSAWCQERCREAGVHNTKVLIQGVDTSIFKPGHNNHEPFRIFSGGKFEYRKGQDLVIAAFREFAKDHPEAHLVCSWFNPWPKLIEGMRGAIKLPDARIVEAMGRVAQEELFRFICVENGLKLSQFTILPQLTHAELACEMTNTDCGLFPNRCEGGTNLVLMEYAACGRPVIAVASTGHLDVLDLIEYPYAANHDANGWAETRIEWLTDAMESAYQDRNDGIERVAKIPSWSDSVDTIVLAITEVMGNSQEWPTTPSPLQTCSPAEPSTAVNT